MGTRRRYQSPVRQEQAARTRGRITAAARDLFTRHGFAGTTVAAIAEAAGVSQPTVYATFGSKGAVLGALLTQLEEDADAAGWAARIGSAAGPRDTLHGFAGWTTAILSTSRRAIAVAQEAASDPALIALRSRGDARRRAALEALLDEIAEWLRPDLSRAELVDRAWLLTGVELYLNAVETCGWTDEQYRVWLGELLETLLRTPDR